MTNTWAVNNGAIDTGTSVAPVTSPTTPGGTIGGSIASGICSLFGGESSQAGTSRAVYPFVHPEDKLTNGNGIWTFNTLRQLYDFSSNCLGPFENGCGTDWAVVTCRINSTNGIIHILIFDAQNDIWRDYLIPGVVADGVTVPTVIQQKNNITRQPPAIQTETSALNAQAQTESQTSTTQQPSSADQIPNETTPARGREQKRTIPAANLQAFDIDDPRRPPATCIISAPAPTGEETSDGYLKTNVNGGGTSAIVDLLGIPINITPDTFLQGLQGGLSQIATDIAGGLMDCLQAFLPPVVQDFLDATGLGDVLSNAINNIFDGNSRAGAALAELTDVQREAIDLLESEEFQRIAEQVPGAISALANLQEAIAAWNTAIENSITDPELKQYFLDYAAKIADGKNPGPIDPAKLDALTAVDGMQFDQNPATYLADIARTAEAVHSKVSSEIENDTFAKLSATAQQASYELSQITYKNQDGKWVFSQTPEQDQAQTGFTFEVVDGVIIGE